MQLKEGAPTRAEAQSAAPAAPDAGASRTSVAAEATTSRGKAAPAVHDAPPQAALAAWRQYAAQPAAEATSVTKAAVQQAFRTAQHEVVQQARMVGDNGRSEVTVRLHPPELGRMKVEIEMQSGKVDVKIRVEDPDVREAMRAELQNLDRTLRGLQVEPSRLEISDYPTGRQGGWDGAARQRPDGTPAGASYGAMDSEGSPQPNGWTVFSESGGIDCLV